MASFKALGNFTPKMRSGALRYKVPSVNLVHWYFNAPLKVVANLGLSSWWWLALGSLRSWHHS
ncbi:hypothetical protein yangon129_14390 [Helicobacter pylori]